MLLVATQFLMMKYVYMTWDKEIMYWNIYIKDV